MHQKNKLAALVLTLGIAALAISLPLFGQAQKPVPPPSPAAKPLPPPEPPKPPTSVDAATDRSGSRETPTSPKPPPGAQDFSKNTWDIPADADKTKNPQEATDASIAQGKEIFLTKDKGNCVFCHGETGAGNKENLPRLRRVPADLSDPDRMPKLADGELFWKITKGIPGIMPGREKELTEEERWHVINYVRTLAREKPQPSTVKP